MEKNFNEQDSLQLINEMIFQAKNNIQKGAADFMVFCGYSVAIVAILNVVLLHVLEKPYMSYWIWTLMAPMAFISNYLGKRKDKKMVVKTHIDKIVGSVWKGFIFFTVLFLGSVFSLSYFFTEISSMALIITPVFLIIMGLGQFIMATAYKFKPFLYGAYAFWTGVVVYIVLLYFFPVPDIQFIMLALCMIFGFCIPGHILNRKAEEHV